MANASPAIRWLAALLVLMLELACAKHAGSGLRNQHYPTNGSGHLIFYNRIPKTGSESLAAVLKTAAQQTWGSKHYYGNQFLRDFAFFYREDVGNNNAKRLRKFCVYTSKMKRPGVFVLHMSWLNFSAVCSGYPVAANPPMYISMMRDPISRQISSTSFVQTCVCSTDHQKSSGQEWCRPERDRIQRAGEGRLHAYCQATVPELLDAALATADNETVSSSLLPKLDIANVATQYFCGFGDREVTGCRSDIGSDFAVERAAAHIQSEYAWVGIFELPAESHRMLVHRLPQLFGFKGALQMLDTTWIVHAGDIHQEDGEERRKVVLGEGLHRRLQVKLRNDYKLYNMVKERILAHNVDHPHRRGHSEGGAMPAEEG